MGSFLVSVIHTRVSPIALFLTARFSLHRCSSLVCLFLPVALLPLSFLS